MAKANKKRKKRKQNGSGMNNVFGPDLVRETLGNFLGAIMAAGVAGAVAQAGPGGSKNGRGLPPPPPGGPDVAAALLRALAEHGPKSIPELMGLTGVGLTPMLEALRNVQTFRLVDFVEEGGVVQLTATGSQAVTVMRKDEATAEATRLLEG